MKGIIEIFEESNLSFFSMKSELSRFTPGQLKLERQENINIGELYDNDYYLCSSI
ncbi:hypothetical protein COSHB9_23680 [Companilactobacillus alimentarius]|nr:hypothetical protein LAL01_02780 [Companilactobacillus alimentarius]